MVTAIPPMALAAPALSMAFPHMAPQDTGAVLLAMVHHPPALERPVNHSIHSIQVVLRDQTMVWSILGVETLAEKPVVPGASS